MRIQLSLLLSLLLFLGACGSARKTSNATFKQPVSRTEGVSYAGGDGSSYEKAVIVKAKSSFAGIAAEYDWCAQIYPGYKRKGQALMHHDGKHYDVLSIEVNGEDKEVYFDISSFFGKF